MAENRAIFIKLLLGYCFFIAYVSTVIGPIGLNFIPIDLDAAWNEFLSIEYLPAGSLQRQDWIGNLLMLVPLGFIATGAVWPQRSGPRRLLAVGAALSFCLVFLIAIKFVQLYFPPRTVSLDYIIAQILGSFVGVAGFVAARRAFAHVPAGGRAALTAALGVYALAWFAFALFPFDFILSRNELHRRLVGLPDILFRVPGAGRSLPWMVLGAAIRTAETVPLGILIGLHCRRRCVLAAGAIGLAAMAGICVVQLLIRDANPSVVAALYRTLGIVAGAAAVGSLSLLRLIRWRLDLTRAIPSLVLLYLLVVLLVTNLVATEWRTRQEALAALDWLGLWPFWHAYIVSKSHAAVSIVAHLVMYAPIGVMVWLSRGDPHRGRGLAASLAVMLSFAVELGRWFRPGLQPDFTNLIIAGIAAWLAVPLSGWIWRILTESFPNRTGPPMQAHLKPQAPL